MYDGDHLHTLMCLANSFATTHFPKAGLISLKGKGITMNGYEWNVSWMWGECVRTCNAGVYTRVGQLLAFVTLNAIFNKQIIILVRNIRQLLLEHIH